MLPPCLAGCRSILEFLPALPYFYINVLYPTLQFCYNTFSFFCGDRKPSKAPRLVLPEDFFVNIATAVGTEVNRGLRVLQNVSCGGNLKQFVLVCLL
jgi:hypothetical protein